jgi:predicted nucleic acid-binding Zn finger protein
MEMEELRQRLLFNKSIASYILNNPRVKRVEEWENCVFVIAQGQRPQFVSKKRFYQAFVEMRKERAKDLAVWQNGNGYTVHNPQNGNRYVVTLKDHATCNCEDYKNQVSLWGKGACKHIYRVLAELGYNSLKDYQARRSLIQS